MRLKNYFLPTLREAPSDADAISAKLMLRAGMIRKLSSGVYEWLPLGLRVLKKVEAIIRQEMDAVNGQEVWLPLLLPRELWEETGRWNVYGKELFRLQDRKKSDFCLGPTHEEVITDMVRHEVRSYRQLPLMLYQFGIKFRDEIRPRFGVMRAREFLMKDAYSFHSDEADLERYYRVVFDAYKKICERCGFKYRAVEATSGAIGGSFSHEFMVLSETGEEVIAWCDCGYAANNEKAECVPQTEGVKAEAKRLEEIETPSQKTVEEVASFLKRKPDEFLKTLVYKADNSPVLAIVRGDHEVNESKLKGILGCDELELADEVLIKEISGADMGFAGPVGLKKKVKIVTDHAAAVVYNGISGANRTDHHIVNINIDRDYKPDAIADIRNVVDGDKCVKCGKALKFSRGIEVGHTFKLGTKYSKSMEATYLSEAGKEQLMVMGCYGIGVSRIVAATVEQSHDENGIIWPQSLAPFDVVIVAVNWADVSVRDTCEKIYTEFKAKGIDVLLDDRDERPGIKFKDADLVGIPYRIIIGEKNLKNNKVELKARWQTKDESVLVDPGNVVSEIAKKI